MRIVRMAVLLLALLSVACHACTLALGHFHQVTALRGRVVGKDFGSFGFRWLRQMFTVENATLTPYEYRLSNLDGLNKIASVKTDARGSFDFGSVPKGHYLLNIVVNNSDQLGGLFEIEVTDSVSPTKDIRIDISPIHPGCAGGHEFIETKS